MNKPFKSLMAIFVLISLIGLTAMQVRAQGSPIEAEILPSQGTATTIILVRFITTNASVGNVQTADIFWDDTTVALNQQGVPGADGSYNYNLTIPTEPPLSNAGNHTIDVDSSVSNYGPVSFTFTFTITEFVPSPEYLALNATYNSLLTNYTNILGNYTQLLTDFNELSANYTILLAEHNNDTSNWNILESQYNQVNSNYNTVLNNYNLLTTNYGNLTTALVLLSSSYSGLQTNFQTLNTSYATLMQDYNLLNTSYAGLLTNYNSITGQLDFSRNLNYILIITTSALTITTIYLIIIKPARAKKPPAPDTQKNHE
jgi:hypothetical protein